MAASGYSYEQRTVDARTLAVPWLLGVLLVTACTDEGAGWAQAINVTSSSMPATRQSAGSMPSAPESIGIQARDSVAEPGVDSSSSAAMADSANAGSGGAPSSHFAPSGSADGRQAAGGVVGSSNASNDSAGTDRGGSDAGSATAADATAGATGANADAGAGGSVAGPVQSVSYKPRLINTTDLGGDPDDQQSMVRQLVTSNEFDLEGLVVSTSCWKKTQDSTTMLDTLVAAYGEVVSNLQLHAQGYPSLQQLQAISVLGNTGYAMAEVGEGKDSAGSELIIAAADKVDPRPLWITCWGGCNTLAQALWKVQTERSPSALAAFVNKLRIYDVLGQDDSGAWMTSNFPDLFYIRGTGVYGWAPSDTWIDEHVQSHGALGAVYPDTMYDTEGDSPSFMYLYPNGLHDPQQVAQGGWGGRFDGSQVLAVRGMMPVTNEAQFDPYQMYSDTAEGAEAIARWRPAYDNDFEARMDWSISRNYADANHHPIAVVAGDSTRDVLEISVSPGSELPLDARGSSDPDANALSYAWQVYAEPSSYTGLVTIANAIAEAASLSVPADAAGTTLHVILQLHDDGVPNLYAYRRLIVHVE